ncbi:hypothetical protein [Yoonia sp.]|uniref:hypothetical protein n=1 Tax=Yoonia sp. TaxID=2212373 RepID=UPI00391A43A3
MLNFIKNFRHDEDGAVTVDFVVLTAAIVLLGLAVGAAISTGARDAADNIGTELGTITNNTTTRPAVPD